MELRGLEPLTPCMPCRCATSCATAPYFRRSGRIPRSNLTSLMHFCGCTKSGKTAACRPYGGRSEKPREWCPQAGNFPAENKKSAGIERFRRIYPVELRGLEPLTPCMPCRCATSCATAPDCCCSSRLSPGLPRSNSNILEQQFRKFQIGNIRRAGAPATRLRKLPLPWRRRRHRAGGPPRGSPSRDARVRRTPGPLHAAHG